MRNTIDILNIPVDNITMSQAVEKAFGFLDENRLHTIYTPNAEIMMCAQRDSYVLSVLSEADMLVADGAGVVLASKLLHRPLPEKVSGVDLIKNIFSTSTGRRSIKCFFYGGKPGVAEAAIENLTRSYPNVKFVGFSNGYIPDTETDKLIKHINESGAEMLFVALGAPKQEKWIHGHKSDLAVKICMGVGGSFDIYAGTAKLAPDFFRNHSLEWLYRLYKEPKRFIRMLDLPRFMLKVLSARLKGA